MNNCILLPIEAESQDTALRIFSTLNDRGKPLSDGDIYARNRHEKEHTLSNPRHVEALGNKALLEKRINIRASDYRFSDKIKYYKGFENARKQIKEGTKIKELTDLAGSARIL